MKNLSIYRSVAIPAILLAGSLYGQTYGIRTFAGAALPAQGSAFGLPILPPSVALDSSGVVYIGDYAAVYKLAPAGTLTRIAGTGIPGFSGDGGPATSAKIYNPLALAVSPSGDVYMADSQNNRVRKISGQTGIITTVAGNGQATFAGDGGAATSASVYYPAGLALDTAGNLYISDAANNRVRKVSGGIISTIAGTSTVGTPTGTDGDGGPATGAQLNFPWGLAVDPQGNVYIGDSSDNRVRKITAGSGIITSIAGTGTPGFAGDNGPAVNAQLSLPSGVALDSALNVYVVDQGNNRIRKITPGNGFIATVAGTGASGFGGDGGPAISAVFNVPTQIASDGSGNLYVIDYNNFTVRRIDAATGTITSVAANGTAGDGGPASSALLSSIEQPAVDSLGDLFFPDLNRVRRVDVASNIITTIAGTTKPGFAGDGGPATSAAFNDIIVGVAVDSGNNVYISDTLNNRVRKVTFATGVVTTVAGNGTAGFGGDAGPAVNAALYQPAGIAVDSAGNLYIADSLNNRIRKVTAATGIITTIAGSSSSGAFSGDNGPATSAQLNSPEAVAVDAGNNVYISDSRNNKVRKVSASSGIITPVAGSGAPGFSGDGGPAVSAALNAPAGIAVDAAGNVFIADANNNRVREVTLNGVVNTIAGSGTADFSGDNGPATAAAMNTPSGLVVDRIGRIYVSDTNNDRVRVLSQAPFGVMDTPADHATGVSGAVSVTGWALGAAGISSIGLWRDPVTGEAGSANGLIFLGNASTVPGARPDVAATYPGYPANSSGWGAQVLTNELPNSSGTGGLGNGTYRIHAIATDLDGLQTDIGAHTITVDNTHSALPFGTIDTPATGATVSGSAYVNFGWALTPQPNMIPVDGSTITVYIDNQPMGHPTYGQNRSDIASLFPGLKNTNSGVGFYMLDTTKLANGLHTIAWIVTDNGGNAQGIGSRFFNVQN